MVQSAQSTCCIYFQWNKQIHQQLSKQTQWWCNLCSNYNASLVFVGISNFSHNSAGYEGGAIVTADGAFTFSGTNIFINNAANNGGAAVEMSLGFTGTSSFISNSAMQGGAISANSDVTLTFNRTNFTNNEHNIKDSCGGAMHLTIHSTFIVFPNTTVYWERNYANLGEPSMSLLLTPSFTAKSLRLPTL